MRPRQSLLAVLIIANVFLFGCALRRQAKLKRENAYESAVKSYSDVLKPRMTRKEVEDYFKARKVEFSQMCCIGKEDTAYSALIYIGKEHAPWFCEKHNVYVGFQFVAGEPHKPWEARGSDILTKVAKFEWLLGCM
jgi:hypothetical protein